MKAHNTIWAAFVCMMALILTLPAAHLLLEAGALPASSGEELVSRLTASPASKNVPTVFGFTAQGLQGYPGASCSSGHVQNVRFRLRFGSYPLYRYYEYWQTTTNCGFGYADVPEANGAYFSRQSKATKWLAGLAVDDTWTNGATFSFIYNYAGDADDSNNVDISDFNILKAAYGEWGCGPDPSTYDDRADWNEDCVNDNLDFNLMLQNFGDVGAPWPPSEPQP